MLEHFILFEKNILMYSTVTGSSKSNETLEALLKKSSYSLLYFYPKDDTPGCTVQAQEFTRVQDEFKSLDTQIIGISRDSLESHCKFIEKYTLTPTYLSDPDLELHKKYGARGEKNNYGKIVTGVIRSSFLVDTSGEVILERKNIKAKGHAERVLKEIKKHIAQ